MPDESGRFLRGRTQSTLVVFSLLALLLALFSSLTHQQAVFSPASHGLVGNLNHLVVASHNASIRVLGDNAKSDAATDGDLEHPDWWCDSPMDLRVGLSSTAHIISARAEVWSQSARFLTPLLRAPPLA